MNQVSEAKQYRPVNLEFLSECRGDPFDIFYKSQGFGSVKFLKFASTDPSHQEKVRKILESEETREEFFVHESDLFKYYQQATHSLRTMISDPDIPFEKKTAKIYDVSKDIMKEFFEYQASEKVLESSEEVMGMMEECLSSAEAGFESIAQLTNKDYYTYTHSVNVGLYCTTFGVKLQMNPEEIRELGTGGMLHDVGKSRIKYDVLNKDGKLTDSEFAEVKKHADYGVEILQEMGCFGERVVRMVGEHHEKFKGGGYPQSLEEESISPYARICKIMDVYDALSTRRSYKKALKPFEALSLMGNQMKNEFDKKLLGKFIRLMGPSL